MSKYEEGIQKRENDMSERVEFAVGITLWRN
jgi:hypothetical protein